MASQIPCFYFLNFLSLLLGNISYTVCESVSGGGFTCKLKWIWGVHIIDIFSWTVFKALPSMFSSENFKWIKFDNLKTMSQYCLQRPLWTPPVLYSHSTDLFSWQNTQRMFSNMQTLCLWSSTCIQIQFLFILTKCCCCESQSWASRTLKGILLTLFEK